MSIRHAGFLAFAIAVVMTTGCGDDKKTTIPTDLKQELPKVAAPAGGGGGGNAGKMKPNAAE
jgi:hypothetical protein